MQKETLWLIDGSSYIYRAFYALPPLTNSKGLPTGAIYGLIKMLINLIEQQKPKFICIALDPPGKTSRNEIFESYKANRSKMPDELKNQMPYIEPILQALGFPTIKVAGEEADDVIGTLCTFAKQHDLKVVISSPDKDFAQLVDQDVTLENTMSNKILDSDGVIAKFGVRPDQIIDYLALVGDTADNIPGISKVGPKTACKWLNDFGSIDNLIANLEDIKGAVGNNLRQGLDSIPLYKKLVTINTNLDIETSLQALRLQEQDIDQLQNLYSELEFGTLLKKLSKPKTTQPVENSLDISCIDELINILNTETISIYNENDFTFIANNEQSVKTQIPLDLIFKEVNASTIVCFAAKAYFKIGLKDKNVFDLQLAQYVINSSLKFNTLGELAELYSVSIVNPASAMLELFAIISEALEQNPQQKKLFFKIESPLMQTISNMEEHGVLIEPMKLRDLTAKFEAEIGTILNSAGAFSEREINFASPKQIRELLYVDLNLPVLKKTAKGEPSTSEEVLSELADQHPLPNLILRHRQLSKLCSTYTIPLPKMIGEDGRIHGDFSQVTTSTGRLASSNPNLQNIPVRSDEGRKIREAFIAPSGSCLISADYSQIELRIMAHLSQDENLLVAFENHLDVHSHTASILFNCNIMEVTGEQRRKAKAINFGLIYGMSAFGLSKQINCDRKQASELINYYFQRYPGVLHYMEATRAFVKKHGYVETLMGRRLYLPDINSSKHHIVQANERAAINGPMQGTSADMIKQAMINIEPNIAEYNAKIILQVHDELIFEVPLTSARALADYVEQQMLVALELSVPILVNVSIGDSWGTLKPIIRSLI